MTISNISSLQASSICLVVDRLSQRSGGVEKVVVTLANELVALDFKVTIVTWEKGDLEPFYPLDKRVRLINLMPIKLRRRSGKQTAKKAIETITKLAIDTVASKHLWKQQHSDQIIQLRNFFICEKPDVAIAFMPSSFPYVALAARKLAVKVVASCHNVPEKDFDDRSRWSKNSYDIWWRKECLKTIDATTCLHEKYKRWFENAKANNIRVIPNFVGRITTPSAIREPSKTILAVGRLADQKDHATLLKAWAIIKDQHPDWRVHIYGDGPAGDALTKIHQQLELHSSLEFKGVTKRIEEAYAKAEIFVIPSIHEGFGLVTAEAMSHGLPVIGFDDCDGTNDILENSINGVLISGKIDRVAHLAQALSALISNKTERMRLGTNAIARATDFFKEISLAQWIDLLGSIGIHLPTAARFRQENQESKVDITIGIPAFNAAEEIIAAIESLQNQTFQGSTEILICDDGSSDKTAQIVEEFSRKDSRIRLLKNETNQGRPFTRQRILDNARGEYITWLDADDTKQRNFLKELYTKLKEIESKNPERICATYCYYYVKSNKNGTKVKRKKDTGASFTKDLLGSKFEGYLWIFLMQTKNARLCNFDMACPRLQDLDFFVQFSLYRPLLARTNTHEALCTYNKVDSGRSVNDVARSWEYLLKKYKYIFYVLGSGFTFSYISHSMNVTARYAKQNNQRILGTRLFFVSYLRRKLHHIYIVIRKRR